MPDERSHRGAHPEDAEIFSASAWPALKNAVQDLCWLFDRGYALVSSVKLVGDRYSLTARQRTAVTRATCSTAANLVRQAKQVAVSSLAIVMSGLTATIC
jgi:hypothetical protein